MSKQDKNTGRRNIDKNIHIFLRNHITILRPLCSYVSHKPMKYEYIL
jgi:hypothetical protein